METIIILGSFFVLIFAGVPIMVSLMTSSIIGCLVLHLTPVLTLGQVAFESLYSFTTTAVPFYIFAGVMMSRGRIAQRLVRLADAFVHKITGGLGIVTVLAGAFFAAISGSSTATTAAIGSMMVPEMEEHGYDKEYALAIAAASGVVGPIIPPSISFVLYGVSTGTSISDLFLGGVIPGLLLSAGLILAVYLTSKKRGYSGATGDDGEKKSILRAAYEAKWAIAVPVIILGGIYSGLFTPTEAGAVACVYSIIVSLYVEKAMTVREVWDVLAEATLTTAVIMMMIASASMFGKILTLAQIPQQLSNAILTVSGNVVVCMLLINILLVVVGCIMDATPAILILSPLLLPVAQAFGISALHFGVIMCVNLCIGSITPPVGCCLFAASIIGGSKIENIAKQVLPFLFAQLVCLVLIVAVPALSTWLPSLLR